MTSSTSSNRILVALATLLLLTLTLTGVADAGRKRIVVLDFEGPKAEKFHDDLVKLLKKSHTVVSTDKWNGTADELDAGKVTEKNVKKVAKKLKIDGVVSGKIEKRRDEYIIRLKLRAGASGEIIGNSIDTKADGPRLDGKASTDIKDELIGQIDELEANHGGGGDDDDSADKPSKKKKHGDDDEADDDTKVSKKKKSGGDDDSDDAASKHSGFSRLKSDKGSDKVDDDDKPAKKLKKASDDDDDTKVSKKTKKASDDEPKVAVKHDDDDAALPKAKKRPGSDRSDRSDKSDRSDTSDPSDKSDDDRDKPRKKTAKRDDDEDSAAVETEVDNSEPVDQESALSPAHRAIDATAGLSFTGRSLSFVYKSSLASPPPGYRQSIPVAGAVFDATFYPLAFNRNNRSVTSGLGIEISYDKAIKINSQKLYSDTAGMQHVANLQTAESKLEVAGVFRYPLGTGANATVIGGKLAYETKTFTVAQALPTDADPSQSVDIPNVSYTMLSPQAFIIYPASPKMVLHAIVGFDAVSDTGDIQKSTQYGAASLLALEASGGLDYSLTKNLFVRGQAMVQSIGFTFKGDPMSKTNTRDNDPTTQDVTGARDTYFGGSLTLGYAY
jgi:hypothetical protein